MANRVLIIMVQASFLALALSCCLQKASGLETSTTEDAASASALANPAASKSSFLRRQLVEKYQKGNSGIFSGQCLFNCALLPHYPTCCRGPIYGKGRCVNTVSDPLHCGSCTTVCPLGTTCCFGRCVYLLIDRNNCGICGKVCRFPDTCAFGLCNYNGKLLL